MNNCRFSPISISRKKVVCVSRVLSLLPKKEKRKCLIKFHFVLSIAGSNSDVVLLDFTFPQPLLMLLLPFPISQFIKHSAKKKWSFFMHTNCYCFMRVALALLTLVLVLYRFFSLLLLGSAYLLVCDWLAIYVDLLVCRVFGISIGSSREVFRFSSETSRSKLFKNVLFFCKHLKDTSQTCHFFLCAQRSRHFIIPFLCSLENLEQFNLL